MVEKRISDLFDIRNRFLRSVHLERDFRDSAALSGYVPTEFVHSCFLRIGEGLRPQSGQRAWRVTGDYGSGKSSFALLLAHALSGRDSSFPGHLRQFVDFKRMGVSSPEFVPVLVTCSRQSLGISILHALQRTLSELYNRGANSKPAERIQELLNSKQSPTDEEVVRAIIESNAQVIADSKGKGLLLLVDELGKFLEFAALNPQKQDVFLLQRIAESASRSGNAPLFVLCILHQGFNAYAEHLNQSAQREWEKVAGRFEEIVFNQPIEQVGHLIASALNVRVDLVPRTHATSMRRAMEQSLTLGWFGAGNVRRLVEMAVPLYPLHPTVLPVLIRFFRRFGQNERSLFSFLLSSEPFGLQSRSEQHIGGAQPYRLHDFFDYVRTNFGHRLTTQSYRSHWNAIESVIESYVADEPLFVHILKTIGILNLLNDDLLATDDSIACAMASDDPAVERRVRAAIEELRSGKRVLYDRGRSRGLCLWPHTSVDLEKAHEDARRAVQMPGRVAELVKDQLEARPIVARRHYIETGNLRHFEVRYSSVAELSAILNKGTCDADGLIVVPLCETTNEREAALALARSASPEEHFNWLIAVPQPLGNLASLLLELQRWDWVATNTPELNSDKYAREEVSRQRQAARMQLEAALQDRIGLRQFGSRTNLDWFHQGRTLQVRDARHLMQKLSQVLDSTYSDAPTIHNELVNRRCLSSAAAAARMRLIEQMFSNGQSELLGMKADKKPPEMSMYLSVLSKTRIHQRSGDAWRIAEPHASHDQESRVLPALRKIGHIVQRDPDARVNVEELFTELRKPPLGLRDGLIPLLLTVFAISHEQDVAFYKDGTFLREMTAESMLLLTKQPGRFEIQYCKIDGVRAEIFEKMIAVLEVTPSDDRKARLLDVVKPLCVFVAQLPAYVHNTKRLSPIALTLRDTILNAREPSRLLFSDLPTACGFEPFAADSTSGKGVHAFVKTLRTTLDELRAAFPGIQERLKSLLRDAFELPGNFQQFRIALARRSEHLLMGVSEPKLRAFCLRLMDDNLPTSDWLESLGSFLALKPPSKWHDAEEDLFAHELSSLATRFHRVESIVFVGGKPTDRSTGVRLAITQADGTEHEQVVHFTNDDEPRLRELESQFVHLLGRDRRLGLAAASRALWTTLGDKQGAKS